MRAIVTGGFGFIGSHLVQTLLDQGYEVGVVDDLSTGNTSWRQFLGDATRYHINVSATDLVRSLASRIGKGRVDFVFHLAAKASIVPSIKDPILYHKTNALGTLNMLEFAREVGARKFVYAASGSCYGIPVEVPTSELCKIDPKYPYALTKYIGEEYVRMWGELYKLPYVSLRLFNVFGPRMCLGGGYGGFFSTVLPQVFNRKPVVTIGDGEQRRDFVYVKDVAKAFCMAAEDSTVNNAIFNIGSGTSVSVNEILELLQVPKSQVVRLPDRPGEPRETLANISSVKAALGWNPEVGFESGFEEMVADKDYWKGARVWTREESVKAQADWYAYFGK